MIKHDPKQGKTVAGLIAVLVVAVGVTVWRIIPRDEMPAVAQQPVAATESTCAAKSASIDVSPCILARDPFAKPLVLKSAMKTDKQTAPEFSVSANPWHERAVGSATIVPALPSAVGNVTPASAAPKAIRLPGPRFELLATVRSGKLFSAVIRAEQAEPMVVEVGDKIEGRYRVVRIEPNRAVLSDGRDRIIAKRPQS